MNCERDVRWDLHARLCPNAAGADIRSVNTEAGMFVIRKRRNIVNEKDILALVQKVIKVYEYSRPLQSVWCIISCIVWGLF